MQIGPILLKLFVGHILFSLILVEITPIPTIKIKILHFNIFNSKITTISIVKMIINKYNHSYH